MKALKHKIIDTLSNDIGRTAKRLDELSKINTPKELAEMASDGSFGCPSYYGLPHEGCKNYNQAMCRRCWLKALNHSFDLSE